LKTGGLTLGAVEIRTASVHWTRRLPQANLVSASFLHGPRALPGFESGHIEASQDHRDKGIPIPSNNAECIQQYQLLITLLRRVNDSSTFSLTSTKPPFGTTVSAYRE